MKPVRWDSIPIEVLQACKQRISELRPRELKRYILDSCRNLPDWIPGGERFEVSQTALAGVPSACVKAKFPRFPSDNPEFDSLLGMARLLVTDLGPIPVILVFGESSEIVEKHEAIHLCQYLNPLERLLSLEERIQVTSMAPFTVIEMIGKECPERALDFLIRMTCCKIWWELEAYYYAEGVAGMKSYQILDRAQISAQPFATLENGAMLLSGLEPASSGSQMPTCIQRFSAYCKQLEQVTWIAKLVAESRSKSLEEALFYLKEQHELEHFDDWLF